MRPKELGQGCAGHGPGPGDPGAVTPAPPSAANPAPQPSTEPEPVPAQAPEAGQGAGYGSSCVSGPPEGARRASESGSKAGAQRTSAFSVDQGNAQSVLDNSDVPWTRFIFRGPFGSQASGLGTGKAAGIWKTPAACISRRPEVSGPERTAFIRELEEGKLGSPGPQSGWDSSREEAGLFRSRRPIPSGAQSHLSSHPGDVTFCGASPVASSSSPLPFSRSLISCLWVGSRDSNAPLPPLRACCCGSSAHSQWPPSRATAVPGEGRGAAGGRCPVRPEPALVCRASEREVGGQRVYLPTSWLPGSRSRFHLDQS